jgi:hypothetical protein
MCKRLLPLAVLVGLVAAPGVARPADADLPAKPTVVIRLASVDNLLGDFSYLATLAGKEEQARQFDGLVRVMVGGKVEGLDTKRPIYLYGAASSDLDASSGVVVLPITDEKPVLDLLERFNMKAEKGDDGVYTLRPQNLPFDVYFRFANKYAYVTARDKSFIDKAKLLDPAALLPGREHGTATILVRLDQVPASVREIAKSQIEAKLSEAEGKRDPGETDVQHEFKLRTIKQLKAKLGEVVDHAGDLTIRFNVDRKAERVSAEISVTGKPGSPLATSIADLAHAQSMFGSKLAGDAVINLLVHGALPDDIRKALGPVVDEGIQKGLEKEKDPAKRELAAKLFKGLAPSLKAGELDLVVQVLGRDQDQPFTVVAAAKLSDGARLEKSVRDLVASLPEAERSKVALDAETVDGVKVHRIDAQKDFDAKAKRALGDNPFYLAIRDDAAIVAGGRDGLAALKDVLSARPAAAPPFVLELSLARIALAAARDRGDESAIKAVEEAVAKIGKGKDQVRITVEGGKALTARATASGDAIKLIILMGDKAKGTFENVGRKIKKGDDN